MRATKPAALLPAAGLSAGNGVIAQCITAAAAWAASNPATRKRRTPHRSRNAFDVDATTSVQGRYARVATR